jgi:hypothetical protein
MPKRVIYAIARLESENDLKSWGYLRYSVGGQTHSAALEHPVGLSDEIRKLWDCEGDAMA